MKPEEVPDDLVRAGDAAEAAFMDARWGTSPDSEERVRAILAAALPAHRKQVIEEAATAVERPDSRRFPGRGWDYQYAAALRNYAHEDE